MVTFNEDLSFTTDIFAFRKNSDSVYNKNFPVERNLYS
ncbi:hypothetical protein B4135_0309 [Caldibacillus debilis]|uniref:Uncharacterized protein n=1 Tax=Caldibacillus debilis TaxID=301148 RepID=A0A150M4R9_9BACI|nr:hypothetical protein B4135_0309 [Caldibacillus debilis]